MEGQPGSSTTGSSSDGSALSPPVQVMPIASAPSPNPYPSPYPNPGPLGAVPVAVPQMPMVAKPSVVIQVPLSGPVPAPKESKTSQPPQKVAFRDFETFCKKMEISTEDAKNLYAVLTERADVGVLVDDSPSMSQPIIPEGMNAFTMSAATTSTRWTEATKLVYTVLQLLTAAKPDDGIDLYFMNRPSPTAKIRTVQQAAPYFASPPSTDGGTPMIASLSRIFRQQGSSSKSAKEYLLVVVTDGEPTDGNPASDSIPQLKSILMGKPRNIHVSLAECTDNKEQMDFLENWNSQIPRFDNTEDFAEELIRVRSMQRNQNFKFTYVDYVIKILLATFFQRYFRVDMPQTDQGSSGSSAQWQQSQYQPQQWAQPQPQPQAYASAPTQYYQPPPPSDSCCAIL